MALGEFLLGWFRFWINLFRKGENRTSAQLTLMKTYQILVADDQPGNLDTIIKYLEDSSGLYSLLNATNGKIACRVTT